MPELSEGIRQLIDGCAAPVTFGEVAIGHVLEDGAPVIGGASDRRRRKSRGLRPVMATVTVAAAVIAVVVLATFVSIANRGSVHHPTAGSGRTGQAKAWQLTAQLSSADYRLATGAPGGGVSQVGCGGSTCFLSTYFGVGGNTALTGATYVSHDTGHTWTPSILPAGVATATSVSCVSSTWCAAGGGLLDPSTGDPAAKKEMRDPELLTTSDAGATWSMHSVPIQPDVQQLPAYGSLPAETTYWPGVIDAVSCTARGICNVVAHVLNDNDQSAGLIPDTVLFLRTTDGGATWSSTVLPETTAESGFEVEVPNGNGAALTCPTASRCIVVSVLAGFLPDNGSVDVWRTTDAGTSWQESQIPGVHQVFPGIACPDAKKCWIPTGSGVLRSIDGGSSWRAESTPSVPTAFGPPSHAWQSVSCTSAADCVLGGPGMIATVDGGATWEPVPLPAQVGNVPSVSCELEGSCIAFAQSAPSPGQIFVPNGGSLILTNGSPVTSGASPAPSAPN